MYLLLVREHLNPKIEVASQNVFDKPNGAFTGEISVAQLKDSNITWTILGHSERRTILGETDKVVASKTKFALDGGVGVIWCCGESLEVREAGKTVGVITAQLAALKAELPGAEAWKNVVIAYEPIWAIGTGKVATTQQAQEVHEAIRKWLGENVSETVAAETRILYGGSVNAKNCKDLAKEKDIDGFLVGGASLKPECKWNTSPDGYSLVWRKSVNLTSPNQSSTSSTASSEEAMGHACYSVACPATRREKKEIKADRICLGTRI